MFREPTVSALRRSSVLNGECATEVLLEWVKERLSVRFDDIVRVDSASAKALISHSIFKTLGLRYARGSAPEASLMPGLSENNAGLAHRRPRSDP